MADNFTVSIKESLAKFEKTMLDIPIALENQFNQAVSDLAHAAHAEIVAIASAKLNSTRQDYLKGLQFDQIGENEYLISLDSSWAQELEGGFAAYNLTKQLLKSEKTVEVGSRAGQPWVKKAKDGHKYAHVPMQHKPFSKSGRHADLAANIKTMTAQNALGRTQKLTQIFKGVTGKAMEGKVAIGKSDIKNLDGLVKYQKIYKNQAGKETVQSTYLTFRTISEIVSPWIHPGFSGVHAFRSAESKIRTQMDQIVRTLLG